MTNPNFPNPGGRIKTSAFGKIVAGNRICFAKFKFTPSWVPNVLISNRPIRANWNCLNRFSDTSRDIKREGWKIPHTHILNNITNSKRILPRRQKIMHQGVEGPITNKSYQKEDPHSLYDNWQPLPYYGRIKHYTYSIQFYIQKKKEENGRNWNFETLTLHMLKKLMDFANGFPLLYIPQPSLKEKNYKKKKLEKYFFFSFIFFFFFTKLLSSLWSGFFGLRNEAHANMEITLRAPMMKVKTM